MRADLNLLEEQRAEAYFRTLVYKKAMAKLYNQGIRSQQSRLGDLVLHKAKISDPANARGKLALNWE
ncbi:hypothetical protein B296_00008292 [Ensete ventricosum]|uniref:Uncharacterized protein n=1 Tax=Ensete ventricosum TaxID=4639 RepID=A0A427AKE1_ENSVE|nr:hypothetical protein B296_00008292 [Ensete ventricosum]